MKYVLLFLLFGCATAASPGLRNATEELTQKVRSNLLKYDISSSGMLNRTGDDSFCPGFDERFPEELDKSLRCLGDIELGRDSVCVISQTKAPICFENVMVYLEECLDGKKGKDLPRLIREIVVSLIGNSCRSKGDHIIELWGNPCFDLDQVANSVTDADPQFANLLSGDEVPSRKEFCEKLLESKDLIIEKIREMCPGQVAREAGINFVDAAVAPCLLNSTISNMYI